MKDGLFPEDACKELEASGFKCMGLKPAVKYSLPASSFKVGSAELPELLKKQLDVFAEVLRSKKGTARQIKVTGHADASGTPEANQQLSVKRAEAVKDYLVSKGADPSMLTIAGQGSKDPANPCQPARTREPPRRDRPLSARRFPRSKTAGFPGRFSLRDVGRLRESARSPVPRS